MTDLRIDRYGDHGDPILLVMGLGMPGELWSALIPALSADHRVATFDNRGTGRSPGPPRHTMAGMVADAVEVLGDLGWDRVHLVGVSMGGMIAQNLVLDHPDRVRSLTLIATHAGGPFAGRPTLAGLRALLIRDRARRLERLLHPPAHREAMKGRAARSAELLAPRAVLRTQLRAVLGHDTRARLGQIRVPTLVIEPSLDILVRPSHAGRLARAIPGARLVRRPEAGHGLIAHDADEVGRAILDHLGRT